MARLFYVCVGIGVVLTVLVAGVYPLPQHARFRSIVNVIPDGGREEVFSIRWPEDRVQFPQAGPTAALVSAADGGLASVEVFRLRDAAGNVVGLASRSTTSSPGTPGSSDWILLLPARGSLFLSQVNSRDVAPAAPTAASAAFWGGAASIRVTAGPAAGGAGRVVGGTEEFAGLTGSYDETWELEQVAADGGTRGHIALSTRVEALP